MRGIGCHSRSEVAPVSNKEQSIEKFLKEIDQQVAKLPPGSDLAGFITQRHREMGEMLARRVAENRQAASQEADFSPSGMPPLHSSNDETGPDASKEDGGSPRG